MTPQVSARRRREIIDALRRGAVPSNGLDVLAVGLDRFTAALDEDLTRVEAGGSVFKAIRGEYGAGKTFFTRWLAERAKRRGFAASEVQISETETPLHRMETVYRRLVEHLSTEQFQPSAWRPILDGWIFALEEDVLSHGTVAEDDANGLDVAVGALMEKRLADISRSTPGFASALHGYRAANAAGDHPNADGLAAWLGGQPHVASAARRQAGVKGDLDHFGALSFLQGLLTVLRDSGHPGLLLVLDEVETLQRVRSDARDKALNALRQLVYDIYAGRFPGLFLMITGTPAFYDGTQGIQRLAPLAQRLATDFGPEPRWDNPRATQIRLAGFTIDALVELGVKVRSLYDGPRVARVDDAYLGELARAVTGKLGGQVGVAPRIYLKKLVADALDPVLLHHIVNSLGWRDLRPLQEAAVTPLLRGDDALLIAPTAAGKTEAAIFPLLTRMTADKWSGTSLLYVCPLKALLNNLQPRLERYIGWIGRRAAIWHGDVGSSARKALLWDRPDVLLTTPESLESMLVSTNVDHRLFFEGLQAVVVDEVHAFAGDDRGWHLLAVLERLTHLIGRPLQRVGLSATVGNPPELLRWLQGSGHGTRPSADRKST